MLRPFYTIRDELTEWELVPPRQISGQIVVTRTHLTRLQQLQDGGFIPVATHPGRGAIDFKSDGELLIGETVSLTLRPRELHYYEDLGDLVAAASEEPASYYVRGIGELVLGQDLPEIANYRAMLDAKSLLRATADLNGGDRVVFLVPDKLEIVFDCTAHDLKQLPELRAFRAELAEGAMERDQRLLLFKSSLRDHLKFRPIEERFRFFLGGLSEIYDTYRRDFELWLGNTFADIKKSFEEKRLKFVGDLNGILAGVQASILAVPLAALLLGDKYETGNPLRNAFLASAVALVGWVALKLLENQRHTLDSTTAAIDAVQKDYEKQQPLGSKEFTSRLAAVLLQRQRVSDLLSIFRYTIFGIVGVAVVAWLVSFVRYYLAEE